MPSNLTVIIPTLTNTAGLLYLLKQLKDYPIIVVDNAPSETKRLACTQHPRCLYLPQTTNQGFARAINLAFTSVKTSWACILNDDIEFPDGLPFPELIRIAASQQWDAISPLLTKPDGRIENIGYRVLPQGKVELIYPPINHVSLDGLTAACLIIQSRVFRHLGGFDGRFFAYLEDVDFFLRLKRAGYHFGAAPNLTVIHHHLTTSGGMTNFKAKMDLKNWVFMIGKNWSRRDLLAHFPTILLERLRNLSGLAKATWRAFGLRSLFVLPRDLLWVLKEICLFPFTLPRSPRKSP